MKNSPKLGLSFDSYGNLWTSYFVGIEWLEKDKSYILVQPKIAKLDYIKMFLHILKHPEISQFASSIYHFDFTKPKINPKIQIEIDFNLFLIAHFLELCKKITEQGLKKNYIQIEENLSSKIKGKIIWNQQIKKNIAEKREDRVFCRYQEYSVNCLENRLLKKTLLMVQRYLKHFDKEQTKPLIQQQNQILHAFEEISDDISYSQIKMLKINSLYNEYVEAIDLAKDIMKKFGYSFSNTEKKPEEENGKKYDKEVSPFWIDMSKLFELYVYSLLRDEYGDKIKYQISDEGKRQTHGKYGEIDFMKIDDQLLIDTKYKTSYNSEYEIEDIRQLSGYARDEGVHKIFAGKRRNDKTEITTAETVFHCLIIYPIYPNNNEPESFKDIVLIDEKRRIFGFTKFYKYGIKLPLKT